MDPSANHISNQPNLEECNACCALKHSHGQGWRKIVLNFTPSWFSVTMGTGIVSILLHNLPYNAVWLYWISVAFFGLNVALFLLFVGISILRYAMFPGIWTEMINHPVQSLFLGTCPMGLATIINMICFVCVPAWGYWAATLAWTLWWIDVVLAIGTCFYLPFLITYKHEDTKLSTMTAAWLLPIVATIVASASGGVVASILPDPSHALWTITVSYILWGCGVPLAMFVLVMYLQRLTVYKLPAREVIVSVFLPLGPLGQGSFAIMQLGIDSLATFEQTGYIPQAPLAGQIFYAAGILVAFIMWGFGLVWLFFAVASVTRRPFPFNLGWWGFTFPLGVFAVATNQFGKELPSPFFKILGTIFSLIVVILWAIVSVGTIRAALTGKIFYAPCVAKWEDTARHTQHHEHRSAASVS